VATNAKADAGLSERLPSSTETSGGVAGIPCPLLSDVADCGEDKTVDDIKSGNSVGSVELRLACPFTAFAGERGGLRISGAETWRASARALTREGTLGKRSCGCLARLPMMTAAKAGEISGFTRVGGGGSVLRCCSRTMAGLLLRKGRVPVKIS